MDVVLNHTIVNAAASSFWTPLPAVLTLTENADIRYNIADCQWTSGRCTAINSSTMVHSSAHEVCSSRMTNRSTPAPHVPVAKTAWHSACALHHTPTALPAPPLAYWAQTLFSRRHLLCSLAAGLTLGGLSPPAAVAENVRLADVKNPTLQAGIRAATEGRWSDAERLFQIVLKDEPQLASAWSNLGNVHLQLGRPQDALRDYNNAVDLADYAPVPYVNRALAHESLALLPSTPMTERASQLRAALADLNTAITLDDKEFTAFFNRGNVLMRLEEYPAARDSYREAADLAPGIAGYRLRSATLYYQCDQFQEAVNLTKGVLRKNPQYGEAHLVLAAMYWSQGDAARAEEQFDRATALDRRWGNREAVQQLTLWPPKLYVALDDFMSFTVR